MKKICVMHQASIGDTLMATPVYRAIKECYPQCKTVVITSYLGYELLYKNPYIDVLIPYKKGDAVFPIIKAIWRSEAALILDYHYRNALYSFLSMIPKRVGYGHNFINIKLTDRQYDKFEAFNYLQLAEQIGIHTNDLSLTRPYIAPEEREHVDKIYNEVKSSFRYLIIIAPYSLSRIKDWSPVNYCEIIERFKSSNCAAAVIGGKNQYEIVNKEIPNAINLAGKTNLRESAELISRADLQICGCTSMLHVCSTTNTPVIAIYGPTSDKQWAPRKNCIVINHQLDCSPCYNVAGKEPCSDAHCLTEISVDEVWNAVKKVLNL